MFPTFADPKTDLVFKRIFGGESHKHLLIDLLNALLELDGSQRIVDLEHLSPKQHVAVPEMKLSLVDVKCTDAEGRRYVVEMQVLNVEGFEKRFVYDASKAYVMQLRQAEHYPTLCDVVAVTICDFLIWPDALSPEVPMLSRWRMQEQHNGARGLSQVQYVFLELPKYMAGSEPATTVEKWAYFFREAENRDIVPPPLATEPYRDALDVARRARFSPREWEAYERAKMAEQDTRGMLTLARREGKAEGITEGIAVGKAEGIAEGIAEGKAETLRRTIRDVCEILGIELTAARAEALEGIAAPELEALWTRIKRERSWA